MTVAIENHKIPDTTADLDQQGKEEKKRKNLYKSKFSENRAQEPGNQELLLNLQNF